MPIADFKSPQIKKIALIRAKKTVLAVFPDINLADFPLSGLKVFNFTDILPYHKNYFLK